MRHRLHLLVWALSLIVAVAGKAQTTYVWTGLGADKNFETGANWQGGVAPAGLATDILVFGNSVQQDLLFNLSRNVGDITFTGIQNGYYLSASVASAPSLTLSGGITTGAGSIYWGVINTPLVLTGGSHTINTGGADIYLWGAISGGGGLVKSGNSSIYLNTANTYTGGTTINQGSVHFTDASAFGTGTVTFNGGLLDTNYFQTGLPAIILPNAFALGANVALGQEGDFGTDLGIAGAITALGSTVHINVAPDKKLYLSGAIGNTAANPAYTFTTGTTILSGTNTYTGGTTINDGQVIFNTAASIPATGLIGTNPGGYAGLADPTAVAAFVSHLDAPNFAGVFGFDTNPATSSEPTAFAGTIDLSGFANTSLAFGTRSSAILYGNIVESPAAANYAFTGHGLLFLKDEPAQPSYALAGFHGLLVTTLDDGSNPLLLVLSRSATNTYTGQTFAEGGGIVFDSPGALPVGGSLGLDNGSYLGFTEASGVTPAQALSQLVSYQSQSVLGFDSHDYINNLAYPSPANPQHIASPATVTINNLDLTSLLSPIYVGTASRAIIAGSLSTSNDGTDDYYFTGYQGGALQVDAALSGLNRIVFVGLPTDDPKDLSSVLLTNTGNSYTGGTTLQSGHLILGGNGVLGTGPLDVSANSGVASLGTGPSPVTLANAIVLDVGDLNLEPSPTGALTLAGTVSGFGGRLLFGGNTRALIISGNNTYTGGNLFTNQGVVTAQSNTALGTGPVELQTAAQVYFTSAAPVIGGLVTGSNFYNGDIFVDSAIYLAGVGGTTLTINQAFDSYYDGDIMQSGGTGALVKTGTGSLRLNGLGNYTGGTTISQGLVIAGNNGALGTGPITLNGGALSTSDNLVTLSNAIVFGPSGGTLSGNGTIAVPITVGTNVILSPGFSPGNLSFSSGLTLAAGGQLVFQVEAAGGSPGTGYDLLSISGNALAITATSGAPFTIKIVSLNLAGTGGLVADFSAGNPYSWMIATAPVGITGFTANEFTIDTTGFTNGLGGGAFSLSQGVSGGNPALFLNFTPVPEPSTYALLTLGLGSVAFTALRRRRQ